MNYNSIDSATGTQVIQVIMHKLGENSVHSVMSARQKPMH